MNSMITIMHKIGSDKVKRHMIFGNDNDKRLKSDIIETENYIYIIQSYTYTHIYVCVKSLITCPKSHNQKKKENR